MSSHGYVTDTTRFPLKGTTEKFKDRLKRCVIGLAKAAAAIRINHSGRPSKPMAVGFTVSKI